MASVGQKLKDARIAKGLTLDDLQQTTKIQKRYLIAIEEGNYDALPGKFYVKAFARQYAETVGLNPNFKSQRDHSRIRPRTWNAGFA